ncbi:MAG: DUF4058 family protein [Planctomycetes bacterium]|nr:DUF4058 family protein [Planctomycetota bacterium]
MSADMEQASPFPGMDPYLEDPEIWPSFHHRIANEIADQLNPSIGPKYYADVSLRTVGEMVRIGTARATYPDTGVYRQATPTSTEPARRGGAALAPPPAPVQRVVLVEGQTRLRAVHVYLTGTDQLVTTIEILSPYNKRRGEGLQEYREKRARILNSSAHLMELDLLRRGERPGPEVQDPPLDADYVLLLNRFREDDRRISDIWPVSLSESLPRLPVPLLAPDPDAVLDLNAAVRAVYGRAGYGWRLDYDRPVPLPELRPPMAVWVQASRRGS